jgi:uncharacterized membrane protein required for colicin V production
VIEFIERLTALDILFLLLWLAAIVYGVRTGAVRQIFMIGAVVVGAIIGSALAGPLSVWTGPMSGAGREAILPFTYAVLVVLCALLVYVVVIRSYPHTRSVRMPTFDNVAGAIVGFFTGLVIVMELAAITDLTTRGQWALLDGARASVQAQLAKGPLLPLVADTFPLVSDSLYRLLPQA